MWHERYVSHQIGDNMESHSKVYAAIVNIANACNILNFVNIVDVFDSASYTTLLALFTMNILCIIKGAAI